MREEKLCGYLAPGDRTYYCTRVTGHDGDHVATIGPWYAKNLPILASWPQTTTVDHSSTAEQKERHMIDTSVRNVATFSSPLTAIRNGQPARILAVGDQEGKSPVYLATNNQGQSEWNSMTEFTVIDSESLPPSLEALQNVHRTLNSATTGGGATKR